MDYIEKCDEEAVEYASRAAEGGANYEDSYDYFMNKCVRKCKNKDEELDEIDFN
jgi:hypothetical protein